MNRKYYAVCYHGPQGIGNSFGFAFLWNPELRGAPPWGREATATVLGPFPLRRAQREVRRMEYINDAAIRATPKA